MSLSSFLNSNSPHLELLESLFKSISWPSSNFPWISVIRESFKLVNKSTMEVVAKQALPYIQNQNHLVQVYFQYKSCLWQPQ
jgi:hypothetical protein